MVEGDKIGWTQERSFVHSILRERLDPWSISTEEILAQRLTALSEIEIWANALTEGVTRDAYLFLIPYYRSELRNYLDQQKEEERVKGLLAEFPRPPLSSLQTVD